MERDSSNASSSDQFKNTLKAPSITNGSVNRNSRSNTQDLNKRHSIINSDGAGSHYVSVNSGKVETLIIAEKLADLFHEKRGAKSTEEYTRYTNFYMRFRSYRAAILFIGVFLMFLEKPSWCQGREDINNDCTQNTQNGLLYKTTDIYYVNSYVL